jgi:hypothetical protein
MPGVVACLQLEVYDGMWHDFIQYTEGCRSFSTLKEGITAIDLAARFISQKQSCRVVCTGVNGSVDTGTAPIQWHAPRFSLPPLPSMRSCPQYGGDE